MKQWREARSDRERWDLLQEAMARGRSLSAAAQLLGISRRHLVRCRARLPGTVETCETASLDPLHVSGRGCRFRGTSTVEIRLALPRELVEWLERIALEWKHAGKLRRASKAAVVLHALLDLSERLGNG
jgi:molybdenum-dependent DNA-binding transcriptional regulator ModE